MALSPEKLSKLQELNAKIQIEEDREKFAVLVADLIAVFEEKDRQDIASPDRIKRPAFLCR